MPAQITRLNPRADIIAIEAEEMIFTGVTAPTSPDVHTIIIDANVFNVNLRTMHDNIYSPAVSGQTVNCTILDGIIVGSTSTASPAFIVGLFDAGVTVHLSALVASRDAAARAAPDHLRPFMVRQDWWVVPLCIRDRLSTSRPQAGRYGRRWWRGRWWRNGNQHRWWRWRWRWRWE